MTIVQLVGTSGSGKTTIAREIMQRYGKTTPVIPPGRRVPEAYMVVPPLGKLPLYVLGSYENKCGGVDTIGSAADLLELIDRYAKGGNHVLFEGLLISTYYGLLGKGLEKYHPHVVRCFLTTDIEVCIQRVIVRRAERKTKTPFNEDNTRNRMTAIAGFKRRLKKEGQRVELISGTDEVLGILHEHR